MDTGRIVRFSHTISAAASAAVVGKKEHEGPLSGTFDLHSEDDRFGKDTWERAEAEMQRMAFLRLLEKAKIRDGDVGILFAGDLLNQCVGSAYGLRGFDIPYCGLYGACSTMAEGIGLAALAIESGAFSNAAAVASSHFCSAERQYRNPVEYGGQRPPSAQWTVTGCGAMLLQDSGEGPYLTEFLPGRVIDRGIRDANQMGAAMAPAAADTLLRYFKESGNGPGNFDAILTGDLGACGHRIVLEEMTYNGYDLQKNYNDCGLLIYSAKEQDVHSGGSGCGCSAAVLCGFVMQKLRRREWHDVLLIGTGAMMSPTVLLQGESIPGVAHLLHFSTERGGRA